MRLATSLLVFAGVAYLSPAWGVPPSVDTVYSVPFGCSTDTHATLAQKPQRLSDLDDYRVMREQTDLFLGCIKDAFQDQSDAWRLAHPYALMADLYQMGRPYLEASMALLERLRRAEVEKVFDQMDQRLNQFLKLPPGQRGPVVLDAETRALKKWLRSLRSEVEVQSRSAMGVFVTTVGDFQYASALKDAFGRKYRSLRTQLCTWKSVADRELKERASDPSQMEPPGLPPQIFYCP